MSDYIVAETILSQIKALDPRATLAWGAKEFIGFTESSKNLGSLRFKATNNPNFKSIFITISLEFNDTYTISAWKIVKHEVVVKTKHSDVYCDMLVDVIDSILGYTRLKSIKL
jgi:hypothetical protein